MKRHLATGLFTRRSPNKSFEIAVLASLALSAGALAAAPEPGGGDDGVVAIGDHRRWVYDAGGGWVSGSPAIADDGTIHVGSGDGRLLAVAPDGELRWSFPLWAQVSSSPAIGADGTIYFGAQDGRVVAVDATGNERWSYATAGGPVSSSPAIAADGTLYVGGADGVVYALTPDGDLRWVVATMGAISSSPAVAVDGTIYVGSEDGTLYALTPSGGLAWTFETGDAVRSSPAIGGNGVIFFGSRDGSLYAVNRDGTLHWRLPLGADVRSPVIGSAGVVYVGAYDGHLHAVASTGSELWRVDVGAYLRSAPAVGRDGTIYVASDEGALVAVRPNGTIAWSQDLNTHGYSSPTIAADGMVYVGGRDGQLLALRGGEGGPALAAWPLFRNAAAHGGRAEHLLAITSFSASPAAVDLGSSTRLTWETLSCRARVNSIGHLSDAGSISIRGWTRVQENGCTAVGGSRTVLPSQETERFELSISSLTSPPLEDAAEVAVDVRAPRLISLAPIVSQSSLAIAFRAQNEGDADLRRSAITIEYDVRTAGPRSSRLASGTLTRTYAIARGTTITLGSITLPDRGRAFERDGIDIAVRLSVAYPVAGTLATAWQHFSHAWTPNEWVISDVLVTALASAIRGQVHLDNYNGHEGVDSVCDYREAAVGDHFLRQESYIELGFGSEAPERTSFDIPVIEYHPEDLPGIDYYFYLNEINAAIGEGSGPDLVSIADGKLKLALQFETAGGRELRDWEYTWHCYNDASAPDIDVTKLEMEAALTLGVRNGELVLSGVELTPTFDFTFHGAFNTAGWAWAERAFGRFADDYLGDYLSGTLWEHAEDIAAGITGALDAAGAALGRATPTRILSVRAEGETITIRYL
ncbi:MAG: PQQ-like beta-propeller repeat protein [Candidatus Schekmanbacteria bacterium]|nr:PQQ-like beta-propeller repeat protein [Candidatus Schekmanbacteria bacterium]